MTTAMEIVVLLLVGWIAWTCWRISRRMSPSEAELRQYAKAMGRDVEPVDPGRARRERGTILRRRRLLELSAEPEIQHGARTKPVAEDIPDILKPN